MAQELLTLQNLAKYYTSTQSVVVGLNQTNLTFCRGEFVAITGESGSGKSTLAHVLGGILPYEGGELLYKGKPTSHYDSGDWERYRRDCVSFISQSYGVLPGSSVLDNVTCALRLADVDKAEAQRKAEEILKKVELWDLRHRRAAKLSSGQKQRLSIARALAKSAPVLIADEPTGNLDAENSAMVISLLAEAAKDRLVILITHEFSEAEDFVTRHIVLRDGRVTMDTRLREVPELPEAARRTGKMERRKGLSWFVARLQIKARPVWAVLMLCLFAATVFAMFAFAGTFISNLDDTFTYYYDNSGFRNGDPCRLVVARADGEEFTQEDMDQLLSVRYVDALEEYGYLTDIQYAYREDVDYEIKNRLEVEGSGLDVNYVPTESYSVVRTQGNMPFARTIPILPRGEDFLTAGRLPENLYEVVAAGGEELLGQKMTVLVQDQKNWSSGSFIRMNVTVVGVTNYGNHLYFHKDLGQMMLARIKSGIYNLYMPIPEGGSLVGRQSYRGDDKITYLCILDGSLSAGDDLTAALAKQLRENGEWYINYIKSQLASYKFDAPVKNLYNDLLFLQIYAEHYGIESDLAARMDEMGLDDSTSSLDILVRLDDLYTPEEIEALREAADYSYQQLQMTIERMRSELAQLDGATLTQEEIQTLAQKWGIGLDVHPIQPGEVILSDTMLDSITNYLKRNAQPGQADSFEDADFLTLGFTNMGALKDTDFSQITDEEEYRAAVERVNEELTIIGTTDIGYERVNLLHPDDFDRMIYPGRGDQISVFVEDYAYVDRVLDALHAMGYVALSPYQEGAVTQNPELAEQRMQTLRMCLAAFFAVLVLQVLLLRAMFSMETESYRLLSHIGLNGMTAKRSVLWQILLFVLGGQLLGMGVIGACVAGGVNQVIHILRYLPLSYRLGLCLLHLGISVITAIWTMRALQKQVFPQSGAQADLDWDAIDEEVEV